MVESPESRQPGLLAVRLNSLRALGGVTIISADKRPQTNPTAFVYSEICSEKMSALKIVKLCLRPP